MKPLALQLYSLRQQAKEDLLGTLTHVAQMGYKGVELAGLYNHSADEVARMFKDLGLDPAGAHVPLPTEENINELVDTYKTLNVKFLGSGAGADRFDSPDSIKQVAEQFQAAAELLKAHDMQLVYHNHWWEMETFDGTIGLDLLYQEAPDLAAEIDTYWASNFGQVDVPDFVARHADRTPLLHIKDGPLKKDQAHVAVGSGMMDVASVIQAADEQTLGWLIVELDRCDTDMVQAVADSAKYLIDNRLAQPR
ncbi:MAG: sugar phosphate isomerase/epimerase family protein [Phycisphaerae bacterium]